LTRHLVIAVGALVIAGIGAACSPISIPSPPVADIETPGVEAEVAQDAAAEVQADTTGDEAAQPDLGVVCSGALPWEFEGKCVECLKHADCKFGTFCEPTVHECHDGFACKTDGDCPASGCICQGGVCHVASDKSICVQKCEARCDGSCPLSSNEFSLACKGGICLDMDGGCDTKMKVACCGIGRRCWPLTAFGIPLQPTPDKTPTAICDCVMDKDCINGRPCTPTSVLCSTIPALCANSGGKPPEAWPASVCYELGLLSKSTP
jgi:hypothetical protein